MILHRSPGGRLLRQLCAGSAALVVVQLLLLRQPDLGHLFAVGPSGLVVCIGFGLVAFLAWLLTEVRWPLVAWAVVVLLVAIDQTTHQPQLGDRDDFGAFAEGTTVPAPLLSAHGPSQAPRADRLSRNGD